ncbi:MAG: cysteine-rich KTR domain-containing protein [Oscillospiraceae bacterium]|nr:cysteine-rich KTR domain-containing protein [Oscillospiraceae bacterium]
MNKTEDSIWVRCPICQGKTRTKVYADTVLVRFPLFCPKCKKETCIDVVQLKMTSSKEPDA